MGGDSSPPPAPSTPQSWGGQPNYIPQDQAGMDTSYQALFGNVQSGANALSGFTPTATNSASQMISNPYSGQVLQGALQGQNIAQYQAVPNAVQGAANLQTQANQSLPYANEALQQGFDPQQALYNRQYQQLMDQQNAQAAMGGLGGSPYAAGLAAQAGTNFNIDWQQSQLAREQAAAGTYNTLMNQAGADYSGASSLSGQAIKDSLAAGELAYQGYNMPYQTDLSTLNALGGAETSLLQPSQQGITDAGQYLNLGTSASGSYNSAVNQAYQNQLAAYNAQQSSNQSMFGDIGSLVGGVSNFATSDWVNAPTQSIAGYKLW